MGTVRQGLPQRGGIIVAGGDAVHDGIGHHRSRVVAHHAVAVARAGPLGQEAALAIGIGQACQHLLALVGIDQVEQREQAAECVPEARVGEQIALVHLPVIGAVVHHLALRVYLVETAWEQQCPIETGVECAQVVAVIVLCLDATQHVVPAVAPGTHDLVERAAAQLLQVEQGLLGADERGGDAGMHQPRVVGKAHDGPGMAGGGLHAAGHDGAVGHGGAVGQRLVKLDDKP